MPNNVNFQVPFLPQAGITDAILAALHQGASENLQQKQLGIEQQRANSETQRNQVLNGLTQAQITHEGLQAAYEKETDPLKKQQIVQELQDSALKLGIAKHQAAYFGIDADALTKEITDTANAPKPTANTPATGSTPFEQQLKKTEHLLYPMSPH